MTKHTQEIIAAAEDSEDYIYESLMSALTTAQMALYAFNELYSRQMRIKMNLPDRARVHRSVVDVVQEISDELKSNLRTFKEDKRHHSRLVKKTIRVISQAHKKEAKNG